MSAASARQFPPDRGAEVAFAGRSNAGKSSAINVIVQRHALARVSKSPGRTRLLNFFELSPDKRIVDLPGYGYASAPESERRKWAPMIEALRARQCLRGLLLIVDARRGVAESDRDLIAWAHSGPQPTQVHVLLSKADKLSRNEATQTLRTATSTLRDVATVQLFSAVEKTGLEQTQNVLAAWLEWEAAAKKNPDDL